MLQRSEEQYGLTLPTHPTDVWRPLYACPLDRITMVWITPDPFPWFAPASDAAASLFFELVFGRFQPPDAQEMMRWAQSGLLFLSMALTVPAQPPLRTSTAAMTIPSPHTAFWSGVVKRFCEAIQQARPETVFVLFGQKAVRARQYLSSRTVVIEYPDLTAPRRILRSSISKAPLLPNALRKAIPAPLRLPWEGVIEKECAL
jgi:uracil DNA glycosylase